MLFEADYILYVDGASRGNPGPASYGFAVLNNDGKVLHRGSGYIGISTNNVAEYTALIEALEFALKKGISAIEVRSDSQLLVKQLSGEYKVRTPHIRELYESCLELLRKFAWYQIRHIPRSQNKLADRLANQALDQQKKVKNEDPI
jgi:ribonuclease HI